MRVATRFTPKRTVSALMTVVFIGDPLRQIAGGDARPQPACSRATKFSTTCTMASGAPPGSGGRRPVRPEAPAGNGGGAGAPAADRDPAVRLAPDHPHPPTARLAPVLPDRSSRNSR